VQPRMRIAALLAAGIALASCGNSSSSSTAPGQSIVIGAAVALTGGFSAYDLGGVAAEKIAIADQNAKGGVLGGQLSLVTSDTKSDRAVGPQAALDVLGKGAKLLITQGDFDFGSPAALVALQKGVPAFSFAASPKYGTQDIGPLAFSINTATNEEGAVAAEYGYNNLNYRSVYVLTDTTIAYDKDVTSSMKTRWTELAGASSIKGDDTFQNGDASIDAQITRLKSAKPDFIYLSTYLPGGVSAVRQIRAAGITTPIIAAQAISDRSWVNAVPNLTDFYMVDYASIYGDDPRPAVNDFFNKFQQSSGAAASNSYPMLAYSMVQLFSLAVAKAGSTDGHKIQTALESGTTFDCLAGPTVFSPTLHINDKRPMIILKITNGKASYVDTITPKSVPPPTF
jgi:branched-chain amino acid transport system substrate-binding protein